RVSQVINQTRTLLVVALAFVAWLMWNQWQQDYAPPPAPAAAQSAAASNAQNTAVVNGAPGEVPAANTPAPTASAATPAASAQTTQTAPANNPSTASIAPRQFITLSNDVLRLTIDPRGGSVVGADLLAYPKQVK